MEFEKLAVVNHIPQSTQSLHWSFYVVVLQKTAKKIYNASVQLSFYFFNPFLVTFSLPSSSAWLALKLPIFSFVRTNNGFVPAGLSPQVRTRELFSAN